MGKRQCELAGCTKGIQAGGTPFCKAHGGGKLCQHGGCSKSAAGSGTQHCIAHGGGRPLPVPDPFSRYPNQPSNPEHAQ
jgi:hypothetical protein